MRADTDNVAFRLLLALGDLWQGLRSSGIEPGARGLHLVTEELGGYTRYSAGPAAHPRLVVEWNESSRHLRVVRCQEWPGFDAMVSSTVAYVRTEARARNLSDVVDAAFMRACREPAPSRRTILVSPLLPAASTQRIAKRPVRAAGV